jgi:hypothetical protein
MDKILVFLIGIPLGFIIMIYRNQLKELTGEIAFAEQYLGNGGTYTLYVFLGIAVVFLSVSYAFGALQEFFDSTLGMFFK